MRRLVNTGSNGETLSFMEHQFQALPVTTSSHLLTRFPFLNETRVRFTSTCINRHYLFPPNNKFWSGAYNTQKTFASFPSVSFPLSDTSRETTTLPESTILVSTLSSLPSPKPTLLLHFVTEASLERPFLGLGRICTD